MLNLYVVIRAGSFSRHAVDMPSLCEYYDLYGKYLAKLTLRFFVEIQLVERGFVERGFVERGFVESVPNVDWWKAAFGGKYDSWKVENL